MKKYITSFLVASVCLATPALKADGLDQYQQETNALWSPSEQGTKDTSQDGSIATSMIAWGIGIAVVIGIVFGLVKSYQSSSTSTSK